MTSPVPSTIIITTTDVSHITDTSLHHLNQNRNYPDQSMSDTSDRSDSHHDDNNNNKNSSSIFSLPKVKEDIFWQRFEELAKENNGGSVDHAKLQSSLVSSNRFFVGDAQHAIEQMIKSGKIIEVGFHKYKKR
jgi:hypothetical protein